MQLPSLCNFNLKRILMKVYTLMSKAAFDVLLTKQLLVTNPDLADKDLVEHYHHLADRLRQKCPSEHPLPLWGWLNPPKRNRWPDRTPRIMVEFEIDPSKVLISDYGIWHYALNGDFNMAVEEGLFTQIDDDFAQVNYWGLSLTSVTGVYIHSGLGASRKKIKALKHYLSAKGITVKELG